MANIALITNNILSDSGTPLTGVIAGSGTTNYLSKFTSSNAIGDSLLFDDGTNVGIGTATPSYKLDVNGTTRFQGDSLITKSSGLTSLTVQSASTSNSQFVVTSGTTNVAFYNRSTTNVGNMSLPANSAELNVFGKSAFGIVMNGATYFAIGQSTGEQLRLVASTGNFLIGTTTDAGYKLYVNGSGTFVGELRLTGNLATGPNRNYIIGNNPDFEVTTNTVIKFRNWYNTGDIYFLLDYSNGGRATIGGVSATGYRLATSGSVTPSSAVARGAYFNNTLVASANSDVLVGVDISNTFTNGAYTGVTNLSLRVNGYTRLIGSDATGGRMIDVKNSSNTDCFYVRGYGDAYIWQTLYLGTLNGSSYISSGGLSIYSGSPTGNAFIRFIHNNGTNALRVLSNSNIELNPSAGNVLVGTTTDAGYKLDVNGTGIFRNVLTGYVNSGSLVLGAASSNSLAVTITGYFTSNGSISSTNYNARGFNINIGGQGYGFFSSYNGNSQGNAESNYYFRAANPINITAGTIALHGYNFSPTITSETNATIYAFSSTLSSASNHYDLYFSGGAKNYLAGNLLIGSTTDNGNKLQVTGNITASGGVIASTLGAQNSAEVNVNESSNNLLVYADITGGSNKLYSGGQVKANIYTSSVTTPTVINTGTTVSLMEWYPTTTQGVMIDYVFYIASGNYMRSGTFTAVNDNAGNTQYVDNATPDLNGSTSTVTFAAVDNGGTIEFQVTNASGSPVYMNILTRYIPNIF